jgi:diacylglycerol O-acyltransferase / wax synthase
MARARLLHAEHPGQAQGNKPGWMMVPLPVGEAHPVRRLELIADETAARKHRARPQAGSGIFGFVAGQRIWYRMFPRQRLVNVVVTNVAGPPLPLYLAGARLQGVRDALDDLASRAERDPGHRLVPPRRDRGKE